jgi:Kef-type K+ transport system membrane component KefB
MKLMARVLAGKIWAPGRLKWCLGALLLLLGTRAFASDSKSSQGDPIAGVILSVAFILVAAKVGGHIAIRLKQPPVLGELFFGVVLGNLSLLGFSRLDYLKTDFAVDLFARLGVVLLLFQVGLESTVMQMLQVGFSASMVATLGVIGPLVLGWGVGAWLLPGASVYAHAFLGATLTATSVGITARVLKDLGKSQGKETRVILGAAVIDDVQGLVILAVVSGTIAAANHGVGVSLTDIGWVVAKASLFLFGALVLGLYLSPRLFSAASQLQSSGVLLAVGLAFCFLLAWLANRIGLAPIVGAFAAGLVLEELHYRDFTDRGEHSLQHLVEPIASFLVPVFFVLMGVRTDLRVLIKPGVLGLATALTLAAILGKQLCMLGAIGQGIDWLSVGIGMIPRGEVGLIFANIGLTLTVAGKPMVDQNVFSAIVIMVITTTLITPPALKWSFERRHPRIRKMVPPAPDNSAICAAERLARDELTTRE